jgi:hypothetical protein
LFAAATVRICFLIAVPTHFYLWQNTSLLISDVKKMLSFDGNRREKPVISGQTTGAKRRLKKQCRDST